jgi:transcriptional regulator with XRE-family HTH domain
MMPLKAARISRKLSQRKLGVGANIDQAVIFRAERDCKPVTPQTAQKLARFFGHPWTEMHFLYPDRYLELGDLDPNNEAA